MSTTHHFPRLHAVRESRRAPGLAFRRVFSRAEENVLDAVAWERRDLSEDLRGVDVPAHWPDEAAIDFLAMRGAAGVRVATERPSRSVRVEMERLLTETRGAALRGGYFARAEDAAIFADEVGALLLSRRAVMGQASFVTREMEASREVWRWDAARSECVREADEGVVRDGSVDTRARRWMTLDDPDLAALLAGRDAVRRSETRIALALTDDLLHAAETDEVEAAADTGQSGDGRSEARRSASGRSARGRSAGGELLECIAEAVLERGTFELIFADAAGSSGLLMLHQGEDDAAKVVCAGMAGLDLVAFVTAGKQLDLRELRQATALLVTALEIGTDAQSYPEEGLAVLAHNERRLAICPMNLQDLLETDGIDFGSEAAQTIAASVAAIVSGEGLWQSARIAETCPAIRAAIPSERRRRADDLLEQAATKVEDGACPAFRAEPERVLAWLRGRRAEALRLLAPETESTSASGVIPIRARAGESVATQQPQTALTRQLPELITCAREVWDGALTEAERFGLRQTGVTGWWRVASRAGSQGAREDARASAAVATEAAFAQIRLLSACQPFVDAPLPCAIDVPPETTPSQMTEMILRGWKSGLPGLSFGQHGGVPRAFDAAGSDLMKAETEQAQHTRNGAANSGVALASDSEPTQADEGVTAEQHVSEVSAEPSPMRVEPVSAGSALEGVTLAEAERAAMEHGHAVLVETQLHRISELEEQLKLVQAKARENGETHDAKEPPRAMRHRLPAERASVTHKFVIAGHEGYITVGLYPNGSPGEIFLRMTKEGSAVSGLLDSFATAVSLALQHGVPVRVLAEQFAETRFEPSGATANDQIPYALSIMDYLFRWIELRFLSGHQMDLFANLSPSAEQASAVRVTGTISGPKSSVVPNLSRTRAGESS